MTPFAIPATFLGRLRLAWKLLCKNLTRYLTLTLLANAPILLYGVLMLTAPTLLLGNALWLTISIFILALSITLVVGIGALLQLTQAILYRQRATLQAALLSGMRNFWLYSRIFLRTFWYLLWPMLVAEIGWLLIFIAVSVGLGAVQAFASMPIAMYIMFAVLVLVLLGLTLWRMPPVMLALPITQHEAIRSANAVLVKAIRLTGQKWWPVLGNTVSIYLMTIVPIMSVQIAAEYFLPPMDALTLMLSKILISSVPALILTPLFYLLIYLTYLHFTLSKKR